MADFLSKKEVEELKKIPGNVKGAVILADLEYIKKKAGETALKKIQERLKEMEINIDLAKIKPMDFYPEFFSVLIILLAKEILNLDEDGIFEMGMAAPKLSFFIKILTKFFVSPRKCFEEAPMYWKRHFDFGELEPVQLDEEKKYAIIRVKGYKFHPLICHYHRGYFVQIVQFLTGSKEITANETKCIFRGDPYHEYLIKWK